MIINNRVDEHMARGFWEEQSEKPETPWQIDFAKDDGFYYQGEDGVGHFNYYDRIRQLSFQWNGLAEQPITVSYGGYGERPKWQFGRDETDLDTDEVFDDAASFARWFQQLCDQWIQQYEDAALQ